MADWPAAVICVMHVLMDCCPEFVCEAGPDEVVFRASHADGVDVALMRDGQAWSVGVGAMIVEVDALDQALALVQDAVTGAVRLRLEWAGKHLAAAALEREGPAGVWSEAMAAGFRPRWPWRKKRTTYGRNDWVDRRLRQMRVRSLDFDQ